jgi:hypothetical protein
MLLPGGRRGRLLWSRRGLPLPRLLPLSAPCLPRFTPFLTALHALRAPLLTPLRAGLGGGGVVVLVWASASDTISRLGIAARPSVASPRTEKALRREIISLFSVRFASLFDYCNH